jgi:dipeptidyl aminopeptidase/acylaminoacyl peptidase
MDRFLIFDMVPCMALVIIAIALMDIAPPVRAQEAERSERETMCKRYREFPTYVKGGQIEPHWMADGNSFWYSEKTKNGAVIFKVDPVQNKKTKFFITKKLRSVLRQKLGYELPGKGVPFDVFDLSPDGKWAFFMVEDQHFRLCLDDYTLNIVPYSELKGLQSHQKFQNRWGYQVEKKASPDGKWFAGIEDFNLYLRSSSDDKKMKITSDGVQDYGWEVAGWPEPAALWSPDSSKIVLKKIDDRGVMKLPIVDYSKHPQKVEWFLFPWAGERHPRPELYVVDVASKRGIMVDLHMEPGAHIYLLQWHPDGSEFFFLQVDRFFKRFVLLAADPTTGKTRPVLTEQDEAHYVDVHPEGDTIFTLLPESKRFIWLSQRNGWRHLYLYDLTGKLIRQLTQGVFPVERIVAVDVKNDWLYFTARSDHNRIYDTHLCRVNLEGEEFQQLTEEPGKHEEHSYGVAYEIEFSPSKKYFLDTHSSNSRPPRVDLRRADGIFLQTLTFASTDSLEKLRWKSPEEFVVKAADGTTDLYGVLYKPFDFDPEKKYPVIEYVYGTGPIVPRTFVPNSMGRETLALAQLGFITFMIDVRGSYGRGKAFQNVVYGKIGFHEIADHVAALHQLAATRPYMDLNRVGIAGGSYGGYMALHGILSAPDVYHVAVAIAPITELGRHPNECFLGPQNKNKEGYEYTNNLLLAKNLKGKLLLIHGTHDKAVPLGHTIRMADALIRANKQFDLLIMPGEGHGSSIMWEGYGCEAEKRYFLSHLGGVEKQVSR